MHRHSGGLPEDNPNPVCEHSEGLTSTTPQNPITSNTQDINKSFIRDRSESPQNRELHNPIYGEQEKTSENVYAVPGLGSAPHHKFDNPIYGDITDQTMYAMLSVANGATIEIAIKI